MGEIPDYAVDFRGRMACPCQAEWLPVYEAELQRRGVISGPLEITQLIGFDEDSGGTHSKGGASDLAHSTDEAIVVARQMGADASWHRPFNWDGDEGSEHHHIVLRRCPHNGPARYQITAVDNGFNGLGTNGEGATDPGPRPLSKRTWRQGIKWAREQGDWLDMATEKELRRLLVEEVRRPLTQTMKQIAANQRERATTQNARLAKGLKDLRAVVTDDGGRQRIDELRDLIKQFDKELKEEATAFDDDDDVVVDK